MTTPLIIKYTAKRFVSLITFMASSILIAAVMLYTVGLSEQYLGNGLYGLGLDALLLVLVASYYTARGDVEQIKQIEELKAHKEALSKSNAQ